MILSVDGKKDGALLRSWLQGRIPIPLLRAGIFCRIS
jgi:hypothetical protein